MVKKNKEQKKQAANTTKRGKPIAKKRRTKLLGEIEFKSLFELQALYADPDKWVEWLFKLGLCRKVRRCEKCKEPCKLGYHREVLSWRCTVRSCNKQHAANKTTKQQYNQTK
jgi:hypothetical protein